MRYVKVFFQKITSRTSDEHWFAYTNRPSYSASATVGGATQNFNVSIRSRGASSISSVSSAQDITMWLSSDTTSDKECLLYRDTYGTQAWIQIDADNQMKLIGYDDFQQLSADEQSNVVTSLQLSA